MDDFEDQISTMMNYRPAATTPFTPADIAAGAHRRSRHRTLTVTGSALAVAAVGVGALALPNTGTSPVTAGARPTATSSEQPTPAAHPQPASPVQTLEADQKLDIAPGYQISVTSHTKCDVFSSPWQSVPHSTVPQTVCKDVNDGNFDHDTTNIAIQSTGSGPDYIVSGEYLGKTAPTSITVDYGAKHYTATILRTAGQDDWVAYYVQMTADMKAAHLAVTAYDATGAILATQSPPMSVTAPPTTANATTATAPTRK